MLKLFLVEKRKLNISKQLVNPQWQLKNKEKIAGSIFGFFECLLTQNLTNQDSQLS